MDSIKVIVPSTPPIYVSLVPGYVGQSGYSGYSGYSGGGSGGDDKLVKIAFIEEAQGTIHFEPYDAEWQIEVYKYTTKETGPHVHREGTIYPDHIGKRYKVAYQVARGATSWTMPAKYVLHHKKNYFKFGLFNIATKARSSLSALTIQTVNDGGNSKILILG